MSALRYRPEIDGLRAIAVCAVLLYHVGLTGFGGGFVGVDVFFVISGFLITRLIVDASNAGTFRFADFYVRRLRRLFPALAFTLATSFVAGALLLSPEHLARMSGATISSLFSFSNFYFWSESGYFGTESGLKPLLHTWSLSVEEQFYLVWPAILILLLTRLPRRFVPVCIFAGSLVGLWVSQRALAWDPDAAFFLMPFRIAEFGCGAMLVWLDRLSPRTNAARELWVGSGLVMIGGAVHLYSDETAFPGVHAMLPCVGTALVIHARGSRVLGRLLTNGLSLFVGRTSYSLYLVHWPIVVYTRYFTFEAFDAATRAIIIAASFALAAWMVRFIETPLRHPATAVAWAPARFAAACALGGCLLLVPVGHAWISHGWSWRGPARMLGEEGAVADAGEFHRRFYGGVDCREARCESGRGELVAYVIGDSHARHYFDGFGATLPEHRFVFYRSDACDFWSIDHQAPLTAALAQACRDTKALAFDAIRRVPGPIFVSESWLRLVHLPLRNEATGREIDLTQVSNTEIARFIVDEVVRLREALGVEQVVLMGAVPRFGDGSPYGCLDRLPWLPLPESCRSLPRSHESTQRSSSLNAALASAIAGRRDTQLAWLDPFDALCDAASCRNQEDGLPNYSDPGHLSTWGSRRVVAHFRPSIEGLLSL